MSQVEQFNYYLITGTSRGIGEAIAKALMADGNIVFCVSRNQNPSIGVQAFVKHRQLHDLTQDLNNVGKIKEMGRKIFREIPEESVKSITLINNAGIIHPIRKIGTNEASERIIRNMNVNLTAAMLLTDIFVREVQDWDCPKRILNLTTGAAQRPMAGWSAYCAAKAGLEMYANCLAEEQKEQAKPVKIVAFAPGVVNTEMQEEIRQAPDEAFSDKARFVELHEQDKLLAPEYVAEKIIELIHSDDFGSKLRMDIRTDL